MSANVKNILANANLTETEGKVILGNFGVAAELFPLFKDKLSASFSFGNDTDESNTKEAEGTLSSTSILNRTNFVSQFFNFFSLSFIHISIFYRFAIPEGR